MGLRTWCYQTMTGSQPILDIVNNRIFQGESLDGAPRVKPFLVYRLGNTSPDNRVRQARRQYLTVYCHDEAHPGDYSVIDDMVDAVIKTFDQAPPAPEVHLMEAKWLETSADFDDREMGTILRYVRFHLILSQWTQ